MATETESHFDINGQKLYTKTWTPTGPIKANLVLVHGYSDHVNRYNELLHHLAAQSIQTFAWDQRGWGRSAFKKSDWGRTGTTALVIADVAAFIKDKLAVTGDIPLFVLGHSMGGGEVCTLMADPLYQDIVGQVRGWILEAPFLGFTPDSEPSTLKVVLGRMASKLLPHQQMKNSIPPEHFSRDPKVVQSVKDDPLCHDTGTLEGLASLLDRTALLASGAVRAGKNVKSIFLTFGTVDRTCSRDAAFKWMDGQSDVQDKVTKEYEGAYHMLHDDLCKEEFADDVAKYILKRSTAATTEAPVESKL